MRAQPWGPQADRRETGKRGDDEVTRRVRRDGTMLGSDRPATRATRGATANGRDEYRATERCSAPSDRLRVHRRGRRQRDATRTTRRNGIRLRPIDYVRQGERRRADATGTTATERQPRSEQTSTRAIRGTGNSLSAPRAPNGRLSEVGRGRTIGPGGGGRPICFHTLMSLHAVRQAETVERADKWRLSTKHFTCHGRSGDRRRIPRNRAMFRARNSRP